MVLIPGEIAARDGAGVLLRTHGRKLDVRTAAGTFSGLIAAIASVPLAELDDEMRQDPRERVRLFFPLDAPELEIGDEITDGRGHRWIIVSLAQSGVGGLRAYDAVADDRNR